MKKHLVLAIVLIVTLSALVLSVSGCGSTGQQTNATVGGVGTDPTSEAVKAADDAIADISKSEAIDAPPTLEPGYLVAACDAAYPPLEYLAKVTRTEGDKQVTTTEAVGFEMDLLNAVARKMGVGGRVVQTSWEDLLHALEDGAVDVVVSAMVTNPELRAQFSGTEPYLAADLAIATGAGKVLADEGDLKGKIVGVQIDTVAQTEIESVAGIAGIRTYPQILGAFRDLAAGKLDAVVAEEPLSLWLLDKNAEFKDKCVVSGRIETGEGYAFWCKKDGDALLAAMNAALRELRDDGVYQKICAKWGLTGN